jgi:hypothetical protein
MQLLAQANHDPSRRVVAHESRDFARRGQSGPAGCSGIVAPPRSGSHGGPHRRTQPRNCADRDRNDGKAGPVNDSDRIEKSVPFASRRPTSRNAAGIAVKGSTECAANAIMPAHTVSHRYSCAGGLLVSPHTDAIRVRHRVDVVVLVDVCSRRSAHNHARTQRGIRLSRPTGSCRRIPRSHPNPNPACHPDGNAAQAKFRSIYPRRHVCALLSSHQQGPRIEAGSIKPPPFPIFMIQSGLCDLPGGDDAGTAWVLGSG